jgi:hypothetical protein
MVCNEHEQAFVVRDATAVDPHHWSVGKVERFGCHLGSVFERSCPAPCWRQVTEIDPSRRHCRVVPDHPNRACVAVDEPAAQGRMPADQRGQCPIQSVLVQGTGVPSGETQIEDRRART